MTQRRATISGTTSNGRQLVSEASEDLYDRFREARKRLGLSEADAVRIATEDGQHGVIVPDGPDNAAVAYGINEQALETFIAMTADTPETVEDLMPSSQSG